MVTIKDIAEKTGFSRGTVDRALHGRTGVNQETVEKIKMEAQAMGYKANVAGVLLAARKKPTLIGCLLSDYGNEFFADVISGLTDACDQLAVYGVTLSIRHIQGFSEAVHLAAIDSLVAEGCSGLLLATINSDGVRRKINSLIEKGIPVSCINTDVPGSKRLFYVGTDYYQSGATMGGLLALMEKHRVRKEVKNILVFTGSFEIFGHNERIRGFEEGMKTHGIDYRILCLEQVMDNNEVSYRLASEQLQRHPEADVIYIVAAGVSGVCRALIESGREKGIDVFSFDDVPSTVPYLEQGVIDATVTQMPYDQGYQGVKRLFDAIIAVHGPDRKMSGESLVLPPIICIKENLSASCKKEKK